MSFDPARAPEHRDSPPSEKSPSVFRRYNRVFLLALVVVGALAISGIILVGHQQGVLFSSEEEAPDSAQVAATPEPIPTPTPRPIPTPRVIIKEVIKEVPVEVIVEKIVEVPVEVIVEKIVEVPVEVIKEVIKEVRVLVTPTPIPTPPFTVASKILPKVEFGDLERAQAWMKLRLPGGESVDAWYTFRIDTKTSTGEMLHVFALYGHSPVPHTEVWVENYRRDSNLESVKIILHYPNAPDRTFIYDRESGRRTVIQEHRFDHDAPSIFSKKLCSDLEYRSVVNIKNLETVLRLDPCGSSNEGVMFFYHRNERLVEEALAEIKLLIDQIEQDVGKRK